MIEALASRWRYGTMLVGTPSATDPRHNDSITLANAHPEWPLHMIVNRRQDRNSSLFNQSLPSGCYLQSADGGFITVLGEPVPSNGKKCLRPMSAAMAEAVGCPDRIFNRDGAYHRDHIFMPLLGRQ